MSDRPLADRVALVTGAGRNIGRAIALVLGRAGATVVVNVRSSRVEGEETVRLIQTGGGTARLCLADVSVRADVDRMMDDIRTHCGRLDVLVNNAAIRHEAAFAELDYAAWRRALDVCLDGAFHCSQAALPLLGVSGSGRIINIGGLTAHTGAARRAHVVAAKSALVGLTRALAHDLAESGITVNCVSPGMIDTERRASSAPGKPHHHAVHQPLLGRRGTPEEVAEAVLYLASPKNGFVTGQILHVNGGTYLG